MVQPELETVGISERVLMSLATPGYGWVADRATLSAQAIAEIRNQLAPHLTSAHSDQLIGYLPYLFGQAAAIAEGHCRLIADAVATDKARGRQRRAPRKLSGVIRQKLGRMIAGIESGEPAYRDPGALCRGVREDPLLERLVTLLLEERMSASVPDPLVGAPMEAAAHLPNLLKELEAAVDQLSSTGRTEPALNAICLGFVGFYQEVTSRTPGRSYNDLQEIDTGHGLEICRILAREMNDWLPPEWRRKLPSDMTTPYRRAVQKLRNNP